MACACVQHMKNKHTQWARLLPAGLCSCWHAAAASILPGACVHHGSAPTTINDDSVTHLQTFPWSPGTGCQSPPSGFAVQQCSGSAPRCRQHTLQNTHRSHSRLDQQELSGCYNSNIGCQRKPQSSLYCLTSSMQAPRPGSTRQSFGSKSSRSSISSSTSATCQGTMLLTWLHKASIAVGGTTHWVDNIALDSSSCCWVVHREACWLLPIRGPCAPQMPGGHQRGSQQ